MRTPLESWFLQASYKLSEESAAQVWAEIREHYDSACEAAVAKGASPKEADRLAVEELGDPQAANRQYRRVLLTETDAAWLDKYRRSTGMSDRSALIMLAIVSAATVITFRIGQRDIAWVVFVLALLFALHSASVLAPIDTASKSYKFRILKWVVMACLIVTLWAAKVPILSVVAFPSYLEYRNSSLRRKLPFHQWPKALRL